MHINDSTCRSNSGFVVSSQTKDDHIYIHLVPNVAGEKAETVVEQAIRTEMTFMMI